MNFTWYSKNFLVIKQHPVGVTQSERSERGQGVVRERVSAIRLRCDPIIAKDTPLPAPRRGALIKQFYYFFILFLFIAICINPLIANAKLDDSNLKEIQEKVTIAENNLKKLSKDLERLNSEVSKSKKSLEEILSRKSDLEKTRKENEKKGKEIKEKINEIKQNTKDLLERSRSRLSSLYKERPTEDIFNIIFSNKSKSNSQRALYYIGKIRGYDKKLIKRLEESKKEFDEKLKEQEKIIKENKEVEAKLLKSQKEEEKQLANKKRIQALLLNNEKQVEKELNSLRAQAQKVENVLKDVTLRNERQKLEAKKQEPEQKEVREFKGKGLLALKGRLPFPIVGGKVVKQFGKHRVKQFRDFVMSNGIEFEGTKNSRAYAVSDGKVIYVGNMPGYGRLTIIDHGERYYSLYSHLSNMRTKLGDIVKTGEVIGDLEQKRNGKTIFYFEIRKDGKPVDPKMYLRS